MQSADAVSGCELPSGEDVTQVDNELYANAAPGVPSDDVWPGGVISMCFKNVPPDAAYSKMLRNEVESKWGRYGNLNFTWRTSCPDKMRSFTPGRKHF